MVSKRTILLSLLLVPVWLGAQTAEDYFHRGAQFYVFDEKQKARLEIQTGLGKFPDDRKLNKLAGLLKDEEQEQQQQQQQNQQDQQQDRQSQQQQEQKQSEQQRQEQQQPKPSPEKKDQNQPQPQPAQKSPEEEKKKPESDEQREQAQAYAAGQMTPQEAQQLLDAQKNNELMLPVSRKEKASDHQGPIKDW